MLTKIIKGKRVCRASTVGSDPALYLITVLEEAGFNTQTQSKGSGREVVLKGCRDLIVIYLRFDSDMTSLSVFLLTSIKVGEFTLEFDLTKESLHTIGNKVFDQIRDTWQRVHEKLAQKQNVL